MPNPVLEQFDIGNGVDSRSNPLNLPRNRALRMRNFAPPDSNVLQLRYGFSTVTMSGSTSTASINSLIPYTLYDATGSETPYLVIHQSTSLRAMNISTGAVTSPTVRGAALASTASYSSYLANGKVHFGNGTDQKWFDGTTVRDNGLRALTTTEVANVIISLGSYELSATENSTIALTAAAGGTFSATTGNGLLFYVVIFDNAINEFGPATVNAGSGRVTLTVNQKVTLTNLLNTGGANVLKLIARTGDSLAGAYFCTNTSTAVTSCSRSSTTLTVISPTHGLSSGDVVVLSGTTNFDSVYSVTVTDVNTFTATLFLAVGQNTTGANTTGGTCKRIISVASATTTVDITSPAQDTSVLVNDANRGVAASASGITNAGYQFYAALYNPNGGGHVGNRISIGGGRYTNSTRRTNVRITGLPDFSGTDSEWSIMIGRTGDGGILPYSCTDSNGNFFFTASGQTAITLTTQGALFGSSELPSRNGVIPAGLDIFSLFGGRVAGAISGRPTVNLSASEADDLTGDFVGRWEQSWAPNDIETFPTAQGITGMFEEDRGLFCGTKNDGAILAELGPGRGWIGPWYGAGFAGAKSWCSTPYGKFWVTGHKQLVTFDGGSPVAVSDEYQTALLARIGDSYLSNVEMQHIQDVAKSIDHILIKCLDSDGRPFEVIHDFKLRDAQSPEGQGYEFAYSAPLATNFILTKVRDSAGAERLWAGASTGQLYQLHNGANDAGTEYSADAIFLLNAGPDRISVPEIRWYGDQKAIVSRGLKLKSSVATGAEFAFEQITPASGGLEVDGGQDDFQYKTSASSSEPIKHAYLRFQLTSHSADGNLNLNDPPHVPLENYGRIYVTQALIGKAQGA
jgi:hypothetical protein